MENKLSVNGGPLFLVNSDKKNYNGERETILMIKKIFKKSKYKRMISETKKMYLIFKFQNFSLFYKKLKNQSTNQYRWQDKNMHLILSSMIMYY